MQNDLGELIIKTQKESYSHGERSGVITERTRIVKVVSDYMNRNPQSNSIPLGLFLEIIEAEE
jgi:hypothetical protein